MSWAPALLMTSVLACHLASNLPQEAGPDPPAATTVRAEPAREIGFRVRDSSRFRVRIRFMAGYGHDDAQAELGFEKQGRVGYLIVEASGVLNDRVSYRFAVNPVDETAPRVACGQIDYFYPNSPEFLGAAGPNVICAADGSRRVDMYKFVALDLYNQQGPVREAFLSYRLFDLLILDFGRFVLGKGFDAEDVGSMTSKDATRIQRINAETNFGLRFRWSMQPAGRRSPLVAMSIAGILGDGNRNKDYDYFYFERGDLDSNSGLTALYSLSFAPINPLDIRVSVQRGFSGSKVERLPHYFASKRNDHAVVVSGRYQPVPQIAVFGEWVNYTWGITATSAAMLGYNTETVRKKGYYAGAEVSHRIWRLLLGGSFTQEEISRDDSLVRYLVETGMPHVSLGAKDRGRIVRLFVDVAGVRIGAYRNMDDTPFPWISGISPVSGERALQSRGTSKWGLVVRTGIEVF